MNSYGIVDIDGIVWELVSIISVLMVVAWLSCFDVRRMLLVFPFLSLLDGLLLWHAPVSLYYDWIHCKLLFTLDLY